VLVIVFQYGQGRQCGRNRHADAEYGNWKMLGLLERRDEASDPEANACEQRDGNAVGPIGRNCHQIIPDDRSTHYACIAFSIETGAEDDLLVKDERVAKGLPADDEEPDNENREDKRHNEERDQPGTPPSIRSIENQLDDNGRDQCERNVEIGKLVEVGESTNVARQDYEPLTYLMLIGELDQYPKKQGID